MVKFTEKLEANIRQPWAAHYIDYKGLQKVIKSLLASRPLDEPMSALAVPLLPEGEGPSQPQEGRFLRALRKEWQKVNAFYVEELQRQSEQLTLLLEQMRQGLEETGSGRETGSGQGETGGSLPPSAPPSRPTSPWFGTAAPSPLIDVGRIDSAAVIKKEAKKKEKKKSPQRGQTKSSLHRASTALYRSLQHLHNFGILNYTGFVKVCKKHDKEISPPVWEAARAELDALPFVRAAEVEALSERLEVAFAAAFCDGNLQVARTTLLVRREKLASRQTLVLGLQCGVAMTLFGWLVWDVIVDPRVIHLHIHYHRIEAMGSQLAVFRACGAPFAAASHASSHIPHTSLTCLLTPRSHIPSGYITVCCFLWTGCLYAWSRARINYVFMFELDAGSALSVVDGASMSLRFATPFLLSLLLLIKAQLGELPRAIRPGSFPAALLLMTAGLLLLPPRRGKMLVSSLRRIVCAPFCAVDLWSSFCADVLTSFVKPLTDLSISACFFLTFEWAKPSHAQGACADSPLFSQLVAPLLCALPLWCRFMQCLRVYHDTRKRSPALPNALKYAVAHTVIIFGVLHPNELNPVGDTDDRTHPRVWLQAAWVFSYFGSTLYTFAWDVYVDWRLVDGRKWCALRQRRMFRNRTWYYLAIAADFVLRFGWTATLVPGTQPIPGLPYLDNSYWWVQPVVAVAELCRRGMWAVFRLEAEHLHNTEGFRRVEVIPLHFDRKPARDDEGDEKRTLGQQLGVAAELASYAGVVALLALLAWITSPLGAAAGGHPDDDHGSKLG